MQSLLRLRRSYSRSRQVAVGHLAVPSRLQVASRVGCIIHQHRLTSGLHMGRRSSTLTRDTLLLRYGHAMQISRHTLDAYIVDYRQTDFWISII